MTAVSSQLMSVLRQLMTEQLQFMAALQQSRPMPVPWQSHVMSRVVKAHGTAHDAAHGTAHGTAICTATETYDIIMCITGGRFIIGLSIHHTTITLSNVLNRVRAV